MTTNENNFLEKEKVLLDKILLSNLNYFDTLSKDTLVVSLSHYAWCGHDFGTYVDGTPLYDKVKQKATQYGFKKVLLDKADNYEINKKRFRHLAHFNLSISIIADSGSIFQSYYYQSGIKIIQFSKDTTIEL